MNSTPVDVETPIFSRDTFASTLAGQSAKRFSRLVHTPLIVQHLENGALTGAAIESEATSRLTSLEELDKMLSALVKCLDVKASFKCNDDNYAAATMPLGSPNGARSTTPLHVAKACGESDISRKDSGGAVSATPLRTSLEASMGHSPATTATAPPLTRPGNTAVLVASGEQGGNTMWREDAQDSVGGNVAGAEVHPAESLFMQLPRFFRHSLRGGPLNTATAATAAAAVHEGGSSAIPPSSTPHRSWLHRLFSGRTRREGRVGAKESAISAKAKPNATANRTDSDSNVGGAASIIEHCLQLPRVVVAAFDVESAVAAMRHPQPPPSTSTGTAAGRTCRDATCACAAGTPQGPNREASAARTAGRRCESVVLAFGDADTPALTTTTDVDDGAACDRDESNSDNFERDGGGGATCRLSKEVVPAAPSYTEPRERKEGTNVSERTAPKEKRMTMRRVSSHTFAHSSSSSSPGSPSPLLPEAASALAKDAGKPDGDAERGMSAADDDRRRTPVGGGAIGYFPDPLLDAPPLDGAGCGHSLPEGTTANTTAGAATCPCESDSLRFCDPDYRDLAGWLNLLVWTRLEVVYLLRSLSSVQATAAWSAWYWAWAQDHPRQATVHFALGSTAFWRSAARGGVMGAIALVHYTVSEHMMALRSLFRLIVSCVGAAHSVLESLNAIVGEIQRESEAVTSEVAAAAAAMRVAHIAGPTKAAPHPLQAARIAAIVGSPGGSSSPPTLSTGIKHADQSSSTAAVLATSYCHYGQNTSLSNADAISPVSRQLSLAVSMRLPGPPPLPLDASRLPQSAEHSQPHSATLHPFRGANEGGGATFAGSANANGGSGVSDPAWEVRTSVGSHCSSTDVRIGERYRHASGGCVDPSSLYQRQHQPPPPPCQAYNAVAALRIAVLTSITRVSTMVGSQGLPSRVAREVKEDGCDYIDRSAYAGKHDTQMGMTASFGVGSVNGLTAAMEGGMTAAAASNSSGMNAHSPTSGFSSPQLRLGEYQTARKATLAEGVHALRLCVARSRFFLNTMTMLIHTAHHPPSTRHWRRVTVAAVTIVPAFTWLYTKSPADLARLAKVGADRLHQIVLSYVLLPAQQLREAVFYVRPGVEERRTSFDRDARALANIVRDYHEDYYLNSTESELNEIHDHCLDCLRRGVADPQGFGLIEAHYRNAVKHPVRSAVFGDLPRILLIQLSYQALEMSRVTNGMDEVLEGNDLNFKVMALMPVFGVVAIASLWTYVKWRATMAPIRHRMKLIWRAIYRVTTLAEGDVDMVPGGVAAGSAIPAMTAEQAARVAYGEAMHQKHRQKERRKRVRRALRSVVAPICKSGEAPGVSGASGDEAAAATDLFHPIGTADGAPLHAFAEAPSSPGSESQSTRTQRFPECSETQASVAQVGCRQPNSAHGNTAGKAPMTTAVAADIESRPNPRLKPPNRLRGDSGVSGHARFDKDLDNDASELSALSDMSSEGGDESVGKRTLEPRYRYGNTFHSPTVGWTNRVAVGLGNLSSVRALNNYEQGMVLVFVHLMRSLANEYYRSYTFYHELMEDLDDLESMQSTRHQKMETLRRMTHTHSFLQ